METRPRLCRTHHDPRVKMLAGCNLHQDGGDPPEPLVPEARVPSVLMWSQDVAGDHSVSAPPSHNVCCLPGTGHWTPDRRISALCHHSSSQPRLITRHIPIPHSSLFIAIGQCNPFPAPALFPSSPLPPFLSSSAAYTRRTMPIDPIQSHHPLPFKYFSVTQLNYCYLSPGPGTQYSSLLSLSPLYLYVRHTVTAIAADKASDAENWLVLTQHKSSCEFISIFPCFITFSLHWISVPAKDDTSQTPHSEYGIQIYIFRCNFNVTGTIKGYILWFSESEPGCHVSCATSWHIGSDVTWRVTLWRDIASCLMRAHITHHMSSWFMAGWLQAHVMFQTLIAIEVCILVNFLYNLTTLKLIKINSRIKNLNFLSAALTW